MKTSTEIRRENLNILIERYGSIANLNAQLGRNRKDATLSQIRKGSVHSGTGRPELWETQWPVKLRLSCH